MKKVFNFHALFTERMVVFTVLLGVLSFINSYFLYQINSSVIDHLIDSGSIFIVGLLFINLIRSIQQNYHSHSVFSIPNVSVVVVFTSLTLLLNQLLIFSFGIESFFQDKNMALAIFIKGSFILFLFFTYMMYAWTETQKIKSKKLVQYAIEKEKESLQIELKNIQQQFKPHFLFNSLNSINALTISNPTEARRMILLLSDFMRGIVRKNQDDLITLEDELKQIELYTEIEKVRFGERLSIQINIPEDLKKMIVPALILQPLIENSIKYGLYGNTDKVLIQLNGRIENKELLISITNPFNPSYQVHQKGTGYGLLSIKKKMMILYNQALLLSIDKKNDLFIVTLKIPQL